MTTSATDPGTDIELYLLQGPALGSEILYENHILCKDRYIKGYNLITMDPCPQTNM